MLLPSLDDMLKAAGDSGVSLKTTPHEDDSEHCPFKTRHGLSAFNYFSQHPEKGGRFARAMAGIVKSTFYKKLLSIR